MRITPLAALALLFMLPASAGANLCEDGSDPPRRALDEADELQKETFTTASGYAGGESYDARVLTCNRKRDSLAKEIEEGQTARQAYDATLPPVLVKGTITYLGFAPVRYGYELKRESSTWVLTVPAEFHLPTRDKQALDVPFLLATAPISSGGLGITCDIPEHPKVISNPGDPDDFQACRVGRGERFGGAAPDTLLFKHWKKQIQDFWSRPGFTVRLKIINLNEVDAATLDNYEKENIVWHVRFNDKPESRATYKAVFGKPHPLYSGLHWGTISHEFGHVMGMDDEYPEDEKFPAYRDCDGLGGHDYIMCDRFAEPLATNAKGLYAWIATRRYVTARCREDSDCASDQYCDTGTLTAGRNQCVPKRAVCAECDADKQCASPNTCVGKPLGKCAHSEQRALNASCCRDDQCASKSCNTDGRCQCKESSQCPSGQFCDTGTASIGKNRCVAFHSECEGCSADKQCRAPATCKGAPVGKCVTAGTLAIGRGCCQDTQCISGSCSTFSRLCQCTSDRDCPSNQHCDTGTLGVGKNACVADTKGLCDSCSSDSVCAPPMACLGKPLGHCAERHSRNIGGSCCANDQCDSEQCQSGKCTCKSDNDCPGSQKCKKPLVGANHCE